MRALTLARSGRPLRWDFKPRATFSVTVRVGTSMKCWWIMPMPAAMAVAGECTLESSPSRKTSPLSGAYSPNRIFMSVLLPAPFSPSRACISPAWTSKSIESLASTPGKRLVMPRISSSGTSVRSPGVSVIGSS